MNATGTSHYCRAYACGWLVDGRCGLDEEFATQMVHSNVPHPICTSNMSNSSPVYCAAGQQHSLLLLASGAVLACGNILSFNDNRATESAHVCLPVMRGQNCTRVNDRFDGFPASNLPQSQSVKFEPCEVLMMKDAVVDTVAAGDGTSSPLLSLCWDGQCLSLNLDTPTRLQVCGVRAGWGILLGYRAVWCSRA